MISISWADQKLHDEHQFMVVKGQQVLAGDGVQQGLMSDEWTAAEHWPWH